MAPHCDSSILHPKGACEYCDQYGDWQDYRELARINFTGENDPEKAPCPSEFFRPAEIRDRWGGNVAKTPDKTILKAYRDLRERIAEKGLFG